MKVTLMELTDLVQFERNPKKHPKKQIEHIKKSIEEFGWTNPILATKAEKMIVAGHARYQAAKELNLGKVPVILLDMPYEKAIAYVVADNRLAELAETDSEKLAELLGELQALPDFDIETVGFTLDEIGNTIIQDDIVPFTLDDFEFEEIKEPCWFVVRGDLDDYEEIKKHITKLKNNVVIEGSLDGQLKQ